MPQQSAAEYLRHGQMPFFRLPVVDPTSATPYAGADAVLLGVQATLRNWKTVAALVELTVEA